MTECKGPHHDLDDFTIYYDLTTFTTSRLVIDLETGFTVECKNEFLDRLKVVTKS